MKLHKLTITRAGAYGDYSMALMLNESPPIVWAMYKTITVVLTPAQWVRVVRASVQGVEWKTADGFTVLFTSAVKTLCKYPAAKRRVKHGVESTVLSTSKFPMEG